MQYSGVVVTTLAFHNMQHHYVYNYTGTQVSSKHFKLIDRPTHAVRTRKDNGTQPKAVFVKTGQKQQLFNTALSVPHKTEYEAQLQRMNETRLKQTYIA